MTARGVGIYTIQFPDPYKIDYHNDVFATLDRNISFEYPITENVQTLSAKNVQRGRDPYGILYVPELQSSDCRKQEERRVPANVTRLANLPERADYALVAIAPWFSHACMSEYFQAARESPVKAFLVYQPGESTDMPPPVSDATWNMDDGGSWKVANTFPTYALPPASARLVVIELSKYSGNISTAPYNDTLVDLFEPSDYVRLWATVSTDSGNRLPSLWVFLVIVLGLLILVIVATSSFMHLIQRRRRNELRQRVVNGEVDLEALGVKRLAVPREYLEKLPLYTYAAPKNGDIEKSLPQKPAQSATAPTPNRRSSAPSIPLPKPETSFSQLTCPICIDDFEPNESQVRELPCRHIFHPDCVDTFLLNNSSLCPMCKTSVLPSGYCPTTITNVMVRRERMIQRMRRNAANRSTAQTNIERASADNIPPQTADSQAPLSPRRTSGGFGSLSNRIGGAITGRRVFSAPERTQPRPPDIEMGTNPAPPALAVLPETFPAGTEQPNRSHVSPVPPSDQRLPQRDWARQRALTLLGNLPPDEDEEENRGPRWKRGLRKVFPGFR